MCGRYSCLTEGQIVEMREVLKDLSLRILHDDLGPNHDSEVRPTNNAPVIIHQGSGLVSIENLRWGFKKWDNKGVIINARVETLAIKAMFSRLLYVGRCVVPAGEYYEWEKIGREKVRHSIKDKEGNLLYMAGLYREAPDGEGREFVIITKEADENIKKVHDRMPVLLKTEQIKGWLSGKLSPDDIAKTDINMNVAPCSDEYVQMTLI